MMRAEIRIRMQAAAALLLVLSAERKESIGVAANDQTKKLSPALLFVDSLKLRCRLRASWEGCPPYALD